MQYAYTLTDIFYTRIYFDSFIILRIKFYLDSDTNFIDDIIDDTVQQILINFLFLNK